METLTEFEILFEGAYLVTVECRRCGQRLHYPADFPYNFCPYCGARKGNGYDLLKLEMGE